MGRSLKVLPRGLLVTLLSVSCASFAHGQSLAELARKERERRQGLAETKTLTERDAKSPRPTPSATPIPIPVPVPKPNRPTPPSVPTPVPTPAAAAPSSVPAPARADVTGQESRPKNPPTAPGLSLIYTGRSLGALGSLRSQDEHELLTESANAQKLPFKLVSHTCWRSAGASVFLPSDEPEADDLPKLIKLFASAEKLAEVPTLVSGNALLLQDPNQAPESPDLLAMLLANPRAATGFPDLRAGRATVFRANLTRKKVAYYVLEAGASFSPEAAYWEEGEMNRIDISGARLFELPVNLSQIGPRATLIRRFVAEAQTSGSTPLIVDLGSRSGDLGLAAADRGLIDMGVLKHLGYQIVVPFEFELALGAAALLDIKRQFEGLGFLATNVKSKTTGLLESSRIVSAGGARFGLMGLVDPAVKGSLPRQALSDWTFEDPVIAAIQEAQKLRLLGVDAVLALSNLSPSQNAELSRRTRGIDAIVADLHPRFSPRT